MLCYNGDRMTDQTHEVQPKSQKKPGLISRLTVLAMFVLLIATAISLLGRFWWFADLFNHFAVYYVAGSVCVLVPALILRRWGIVLVMLAIFAFHGYTVWPSFNPANKIIKSKGNYLTLAQVNILHKNRDKDKALAFIRSCDADIMIIQELDPWWNELLMSSDIPFNVVVAHPIDHSFGIALLANKSLDQSDQIAVNEAHVLLEKDGFGRPTIEATIDLAGQPIKLLSIHPPPPLNAVYTRQRNTIIQQAKDWANKQTNPHIIVGDLNTTPWSPAFSILLEDGKLKNSLDGQGNQGSWPTGLPLPWKLPIDHCLFSKELACTFRTIGPETGSDHLPVLITLCMHPNKTDTKVESAQVPLEEELVAP